MNRTLAVLILLIALVAGAVVLFDGEPETPGMGAGGQAQASSDERQTAQAEGVDSVILDHALAETTGQRTRFVESPADPLGAQSGPIEDVFAHLRVHLFGENDLPLEGAEAGILKMPDPGNDFQDLRLLFFTMQGLKPKGYPVNEVATDADGMAVLPLTSSKHGWAVYGRMKGRMIAFQVVPGLEVDADTEYDAGILTLKLGGRLDVDVIDESGTAVADANVVLVTNAQDDPMEMPILFLRSNQQGRVSFSNLSFREYKIEVAKHGHLPFHQESIAITERGQAYLQAMIPRGGTISGRVLGHNNQPLPGIGISLKAKESSFNPEGLTQAMMSDSDWAVSDAAGNFSGSGLSAETTYTLKAELAPEVTAESKGHQIGDFVTLKMPRTVRLTGILVQADGQPAVDAELGLWDTAEGKSKRDRSYRTETSATGAFELEVEAGNFLLMAHHFSGEYVAAKALLLKQKDLDLGTIQLAQGGGLDLTVLRPDGSPCERVYLVRAHTLEKINFNGNRKLAEGGLSQLRRQGMRQGGGSFRMEGLPAGDFEFRLYAPEYLDIQLTVRIKAGQTVHKEVYLRKGASLQLVLQSPDGQAAGIKGPKLRLLGPPSANKPDSPSTHHFRPNRQGERRFNRLEPGQWVLESYSQADQAWLVMDRYQLHSGEQTLTTILASPDA